MDQSKKTMRHFYCRDVMWETFEKMANDFDCSIDYLINEGMRYYARSKNYQTSMAPQGQAAPRPGNGRPANPAPMAPGRDAAPTNPPPMPSRPVAAPPPKPPAPMATGTLFLVFNNQRYPIAKDQFIIGRGSKTSDLPIKDGNISRKHAAVIRRNGTFYIKDLGSTNGIDYKGMRIDNKRIDEGDTFHICDYELRFTYR
tara:strand:+ start:44766 stop:45362 length:597 start_codon:yes stop_codon:yes gene_type:complete